jgi:phosphoglycerol transferase MdoB-like AlkP superfamily enzyme
VGGDRFSIGSLRAPANGFLRVGFSPPICVLVVVLWARTLSVLPSVETWRLVISTVTTIITFLLVAVLRNTQSRAIKPCTKNLTPSPMRCGI